MFNKTPKEKFINDLGRFLYETLLKDNSLAKPHNNDIQNQIWQDPYLQQKIIQPLISRIGQEQTIQKFNEVFNAVAEDVKNRYKGMYDEDEEEQVEVDIEPEEVIDSEEAFTGYEKDEEKEKPFAKYEDAGFDPETGILKGDLFKQDVDWAGSDLHENVINDIMDYWTGRSADQEDVDLNLERYDSPEKYIEFYVDQFKESANNKKALIIPLNDDGTIRVSHDQFYSLIHYFTTINAVMFRDFCKHFNEDGKDIDFMEDWFREVLEQIKTLTDTNEEDNEQLYVAPASYGQFF